MRQTYSDVIRDLRDVIFNTQYRNMVGYVMATRWNEDVKDLEKLPIGTIFFVRILDDGATFEYGVTCNHVIGPDADGTAPCLLLRVNRETGKFEDIPTGREEWTSDPKSDIAVLPISLAASEYRRWSYPIAEDIRWATIRPVPGDQVFLAGLFVGYPGELSVQALIRTGTIAREDAVVEIRSDISSDERHRTEAYLIESRSWGGESGSPVFAYREKLRIESLPGGFRNQPLPPTVKSESRPELIGMLHGHFPVPFGNTTTNSGVGIVIPVKKIYDMLLNNEKLRGQRRRIIQSRSSAGPAGP
jgi:hypothetical protein